MLYVVITALFFMAILLAMWTHFRNTAVGDRKMYARKLRVADNKIRLLEMISGDLGQITGRMSSEINVMKKSAQEADGSEPMRPTGNLESTAAIATRIFDDMSTILSIWNNSFQRNNAEFDLAAAIRSTIRPFREFVENTNKAVRITFENTDPWRCVCDPIHLSRCLRAILAQAVRQTESGEIRVRLVVAEPVLTRKSKVLIVVTDGSQRPEGEPNRYDIVPDRVHRNPFLRNDRSATVRLNIAQHTAIKLGGKLTFQPHAEGNMSFKLDFAAEPASAGAPEAEAQKKTKKKEKKERT